MVTTVIVHQLVTGVWDNQILLPLMEAAHVLLDILSLMDVVFLIDLLFMKTNLLF
jgi:hypothetical protein